MHYSAQVFPVRFAKMLFWFGPGNRCWTASTRGRFSPSDFDVRNISLHVSTVMQDGFGLYLQFYVTLYLYLKTY